MNPLPKTFQMRYILIRPFQFTISIVNKAKHDTQFEILTAKSPVEAMQQMDC